MRTFLLCALAAPLAAESLILAPADQTAVPAEVRLIARHLGKPEVLVDGKPLAAEKFCKKCGVKMEAGAKFCAECGTKQ